MDPRVTELHCIMPIANVPSVMARGILSHELAAQVPHASVADQDIQDRRDAKRIPNGLKLHQYANLYFHARNPMMFRRLSEINRICVLRVSIEVFRLPKVVITDQNAATGYARFLAPSQHAELNFDDIFAMDWRHPNDERRYREHRARKCAETLIPNMVDPKYISGAHVLNGEVGALLSEAGFARPVTLTPSLFFRQ